MQKGSASAVGEIGLEQMVPPFRVAVVLPAAGSGTRAGTVTPKQYWLINGRPLLYYTLQTFESIALVQQVVVVVAQRELQHIRAQCHEWGFGKVWFTAGT